MSKLEQFILLHLFKAPALLLTAALACVSSIAFRATSHSNRPLCLAIFSTTWR